MPEPHLLIAYTAFALTVIFLPGPDMLYILSQAVRGKAAGVWAVIGIVLGLSTHFTLAGFGLSALLASNHVIFLGLRLMGACYLLYLAWKIVRASPAAPHPHAAPARGTLAAVFLRGLLTNLLNPKALLFVLALLPQFLRPEAGSTLAQTAVFGGIFVGATAIVYLTLAISVAAARQRLSPKPRLLGLQRWLTGSVFAGSALFLLKDA